MSFSFFIYLWFICLANHLTVSYMELSTIDWLGWLHPFITAPSKSPSKKVAKIDSPSSPSSPSKRKRLPQANVQKNQSPSKFYPNPQAKSILGSSLSKPQTNFSIKSSNISPSKNPDQIPKLGDWEYDVVHFQKSGKYFLGHQAPQANPQAPQAKGMQSPS